MAIVKFGTTVVGIRGTVGGMTFTANSSGPFVRAWGRGPNPRTALQTQVRGRVSGLGSLWSALSPGDKAAWDYFGLHPPEIDVNSLGETYYLRGWQWFVRVNQRLQSVGLSTTSTLPASGGVAAPASCGIVAAPLPTGPVTISWPALTFPAGYSGVAFIGAHPTIGLQNKTSGLLQAWAVHEPSGTDADITAVVQARFGTLQGSWKLWLYLYVLRDDGVRSTAAAASCEVT